MTGEKPREQQSEQITVTRGRLNRAAPFARAAGVMATTATLFAVSALIPEATKHDAYPGKKPAAVDQYHDPKVAGMALAHRYASCKLTVHDTHKGLNADPPSGIEYTLDLTFNKDVQQDYANFVGDKRVEWDDTENLERLHLPVNGASQYMRVQSPMGGPVEAYPTKNGVRTDKLDLQATGTRVEGSYNLNYGHGVGAYYDIWENESTVASTANGPQTSLHAIYCGRMMLNDVDGQPTWQVVPSVKPLQDPQELIIPGAVSSNDQYKYFWPGQAPTPTHAA